MPNRRGIIVGEEVNDGLHSDKEKEKSGGASVRKLLSAQQVSVCVFVCDKPESINRHTCCSWGNVNDYVSPCNNNNKIKPNV